MGLAADSAAFASAAQLHAQCRCFGARIDLLGRTDKTRDIIELKTSAKIQPTFRVQLAGQVIALNCTEPPPVVSVVPTAAWCLQPIRRRVLQLRPDGTFDERRDLHTYDDARDFDIVFSAAELAHWRMRNDAKAKKLAPHDHALYREDGTQVPGIGTVLGLAGLVDLRDVPPHILEAAARKGSLVHTAIEYLIADDLDEDALDPALKGYVESFKRFRDATGFQVEACEKSVIFDCSR